MAYNKKVVWVSPFSSQNLPLGKYGIVYTKVILDVPLVDVKRDFWTIDDGKLYVGDGDSEQYLTMQTSVAYFPETLEVYADGIPTDFVESTKRIRENFKIDKQKAKGKYIYVTYIPNSFSQSLSNNIDVLKKVYDVEAGVRYSNKLRGIIKLAREYVAIFCIHLSIEPPMWIGGKGNTERSTSPSNILPALTPISLDLHLVPIVEKIEEIRQVLYKDGYRNLSLLETTSFTVRFFESLQKVISEFDATLELRG